MKLLGLDVVHSKLRESASGRKVSFVLYENTADVFKRNSILGKIVICQIFTELMENH